MLQSVGATKLTNYELPGGLQLNPLDRGIFLWLNAPAGHNRSLDALGVFFGQYGIFAFAALMVLLWFALPRRASNDRRHLAYGAVAAAVGELANYVIASFTYRARPFVAMPHLVHVLVHHSADSSFPSDHATAVFAVAVAMSGTSAPLRWVFWTFAVVIGVARVFIGVHWPTDILAGLVIGAGSAVLTLRALRLLDRPIGWLLRLFRLETEARSRV